MQSQYDYLEGENWFADRIWTPNLYIENERDSSLMELRRENVFVKIYKDGLVQMGYRCRPNSNHFSIMP
jgi:hypothetical protein